MKTVDFKGECKGIRLVPRNSKDGDNHILVQFLTEDDGMWHEEEGLGSSYWIDELIEQLCDAREYIKTQEPDIAENGKQYGYKFKEK